MKPKNIAFLSMALALTLSTVILPVARINAEEIEINTEVATNATSDTTGATPDADSALNTADSDAENSTSDTTEVNNNEESASGSSDKTEVEATSVQSDAASNKIVTVTTAEDLVRALSDETAYSKVILGADLTVTDKITANKTVEFDLNGHTLNTAQRIYVNGNLTINDGGANGKIVSQNYLFQVSGKLTINGGDLRATNRACYGAYVLEGGVATMNGGAMTADYAAFAGNNTTGNMNFYVNGGTLTSLRYPAIYMPGQVYLVVTGGTLNGGVVARMGQITVSGGTINNTLKKADFFDGDMYQSGMPQTLDAFAIVSGGNYTSKDAHGNTLNMTVTGGTFKSADGKALAIYDLKKMAQTVNVDVTGGVFSAKPENVKAGYVAYAVADGFEVMPKTVVKVDDAANEADDANAAVLEKQVEAVAEAIAEKLSDTLEDGEELTVTIDGQTMVFVVENADAAKAALRNGTIVVKLTAPKAAEGISVIEAGKVAEKLAENATKVGVYEIEVALTDGANSFGRITELAEEVEVVLDLSNLPDVAKGVMREFQVVRYHNGEAEVIESAYRDGMLSFKSKKFSNFTVAYVDTANSATDAPVEGTEDAAKDAEEVAGEVAGEVAKPNTGVYTAGANGATETAVIVTSAISLAILAAGAIVAKRNA